MLEILMIIFEILFGIFWIWRNWITKDMEHYLRFYENKKAIITFALLRITLYILGATIVIKGLSVMLRR